jgi:outer membrane protein TolC
MVRVTPAATTNRFGISAAAWVVFWAAVSVVLLPGCTSSHYRRSADKEAYGIIRQIDNQVFGRTKAFTIDTPFSGRDPKTIPPDEIIESRITTNRLILNLDQALDFAVRNSREYQTQKEQLYLTALTLTGVRYEFSPQFFAEASTKLAGTPKGLEQPVPVESRAGVNKTWLLKTGGRLSVALANDILSYYTGNQPRSIINTLSVNLTQPLLRGFGKNSPDVERLTQAERNVVYALRSYSLYQQEFAADIVSAYFRLLTQKDVVRNNYRNYTNRVEITKYLEARSVDRVSQSDVDATRTDELGARISYINSLASYLSSLDSFKLRVGLPVSSELFLDDRDLKDLIDTGLVPVEIGRRAAFRLCVQQHMDVLNAIDRFEDSKRKVSLAADQLRADLGLFASASLASEEPDDYVEFDLNKLRYSAELRLSLPVDRLRERNTYRAALVSFESQIRSLSLTLDNFKERIDRGLRTVEQERLNYLNAVESLQVAERRVENETMSLEAGRRTVLNLRQAQDDLIQAQNRLATTYTAYLTARLGLLVDIGVIDTEPDKFWLQDPFKDRLTPEQRGTPPLRMPDDQVLPPETFIEPSS